MKYVFIIVIFFYGSDLAAQFRTDTLKHSPATFDERLFWDINHAADTSRFLDKTMLIASKSLLPVAIAVPVIEFAWAYAEEDVEHLYDAASIASGTLATILFQEGIVKPLVQRPRPFRSLEDVRWVDSSAHGYSFPSSHAAISFGLATALSLRYPTLGVIIPSYAYAFIVTISRPYLGVHYPSDILCGAIIGSAMQYLAYRIEQSVIPKQSVPIFGIGKRPVHLSFTVPIR